MSNFKLGKKPARPNSMKLKFSTYCDVQLPPHPEQFGHEELVQDWGMLANDKVGDCVIAGGAHETELWTYAGRKPATFNDTCVLSDYSAITGFDPNNPDSDQGTDMQAAAKYRQETGLLDATGKRHKVGAYLALEPGNFEQFMESLFLLGAVGIGVQFPSTAMEQFDAGKPWDVVKRSHVEGGHYVPLVACRNNLVVVTWGKLQQMTKSFFTKYCDEGVAYVSEEMLVDGKSLEGFDLAQLQDDLRQLGVL